MSRFFKIVFWPCLLPPRIALSSFQSNSVNAFSTWVKHHHNSFRAFARYVYSKKFGVLKWKITFKKYARNLRITTGQLNLQKFRYVTFFLKSNNTLILKNLLLQSKLLINCAVIGLCKQHKNLFTVNVATVCFLNCTEISALNVLGHYLYIVGTRAMILVNQSEIDTPIYGKAGNLLC